MSDPNMDVLLDEITGVLVAADPQDRESTEGLLALAEQLFQYVSAEEPGQRDEISHFVALAVELTSGKTLDPDLVLAELNHSLARLRSGDFKEPVSGATSSDRGRGPFVLPEHVDEEIFAEFLANQKLVLEELEALILALRGGKKEALAELRRKLHTLKGEAGVLGLEDLERVCHATETLLEATGSLAARVEPLLSVKDWITESLESYRKGHWPLQPAEWVLAMLDTTHSAGRVSVAVQERPRLVVPVTEGPLGNTLASPSAEAMRAPAPVAAEHPELDWTAPGSPADSTPNPVSADNPVPDSSVQETEVAGVLPIRGPVSPSAENGWDQDQLELIAEFLQEGVDGLASVDQSLLDIEQNGFEAEKINRLFRVFHTIKGVSGFLEFRQITELAHTAETMLDAVRAGKLDATTGVLDLVFDATALMRELFADVRNAVATGGPVAHNAEQPELAQRLARATEGSPGGVPDGDEGLPQIVPGERVGEILIRTGSLTPEAVDHALEASQTTGRRIGEELIAQGLAEPKVVAHAIRAQNSARNAPTKIREVVKVDLERVDRMVETIGELVIVESMVAHAPEVLGLPRHVRNYLSQLAKITRELQEIGMHMRMVPVRGEFQKMTRMVRDLSRKSGKDIRVDVVGEATEMDRSMVERIADPLVHLIRNAVDHGIEAPEARRARGKPPTGTVRLSAFHEAGTIVVEVKDDGNGIDREAVLKKAISNGLVRPDAKLSDSEVYDLIFAPGFSTAKQITEVSGRGVGMDVVKRNVEAMRGRIQVITAIGSGTTFRMVLPLTLAIIDGMVVRSGEENFIIPTASIVESLKPSPEMLRTVGATRELLVVRGETLPLLRLAELLEVSGAETEPCRALVVIVETLSQRVGLVVDEVVTQQQVVIKNMGCEAAGTEVFSGAAILSDGRVGLIINVDELVSQGIRSESQRGRNHPTHATAGTPGIRPPPPPEA